MTWCVIFSEVFTQSHGSNTVVMVCEAQRTETRAKIRWLGKWLFLQHKLHSRHGISKCSVCVLSLGNANSHPHASGALNYQLEFGQLDN